MQGRSIYDYFYLGTIVRYLTDARAGMNLGRPGAILGNLAQLRLRLAEYDLPVSQAAADAVGRLENDLRAVADRDTLTEKESTDLRDLMMHLRTTIDAETSIKFAYIVTDKHLDVRKLLDNVAALFGPQVFEKLPDVARYDFTEAGRCVALEIPTGAAFHVLRGTEDVLRSFYCSKVKQKSKRCDPLLWGPIVSHLSKLPTGRRPEDGLLSRLTYIRTSFRNPTQHPEAVYDIHAVQDLFNVCIEVVNRIATELP